VLAICASFRASSLTVSSGGLILTAHTSPYLFFSLSNCKYNSHIIKYESFLVLHAHSQFLCSLQVSSCQPWVSANPAAYFLMSDRLLFDETFAQLCIFAVVNCADVARSVWCFFITVSYRYNFLVYHDRLETNLLQLFRHPESSEWFSIISVIIFEVDIVDEQKQT